MPDNEEDGESAKEEIKWIRVKLETESERMSKKFQTEKKKESDMERIKNTYCKSSCDNSLPSGVKHLCINCSMKWHLKDWSKKTFTKKLAQY